jgi:hypothetical protein
MTTTQPTTRSRYEVLIAESRERFIRDTAKHEMTVLHDDGLYRHLRFQQASGSSFYWFDLVTWPGCLVISGDMGAHHFSRTRDMFDFFGPKGARGGFEDERWGINPHYWGEKLRGPRPGRDGVRSYSHEAFQAHLYSWADDWAEYSRDGGMYPSVLHEALDREVLADWTHSADEAIARLRDLEDELGAPDLFGDAWEWDLREFDGAFLWNCWAIVWGIEQYRATTTA